MDKRQRERWKIFHESEKKLFEMLNGQCKCLYSSGDDELKYSEIDIQTNLVVKKPPRFVHWIGHSQKDLGEIMEQNQLVMHRYMNAMGKKFRKHPARFPVFFTNIEQINVTQHDAFSSVRVKGEYVTVKTFLNLKDILPDMEKLRAAGFTPKVRDDVLFTSLMLSTAELFKMAGSDQIQLRRCTGVQYRATIRHVGESRGIRAMLGLMVIDRQSNPVVVFPHKDAPRPHSYAASGHEILLPIKTRFKLYKPV